MSARANLILRIVLDILLFWGAFNFPFWAVVVFGLFGLIYFRNFYEFIAVFAIHDLLYAVPEARFGGSVFFLTIISIAVFFLSNFIKRKVIFSQLRQYVS